MSKQPAPRLDRELLDEAMAAHIAAGSVLNPLLIEQWETSGLTIGQIRLMTLVDQPNGLTLGELAQLLNVSPATITGISDRLVRRGFLERRDDPSDRRVVRVVLTEPGADALHTITRAGYRALTRIYARMGARKLRAYTKALQSFVDASREVDLE